MGNRIFNILIGGEAGQGLVTIGQILARSLVRSGYSIVVTQSYQSRIRGGHNTFSIRLSNDEINAPQESVDILIALDKDTVAQHRSELLPEGLIIVDKEFGFADNACLGVPYKKLAADKLSNIVALGVTGYLIGLDEQLISGVIDEFFGKKDPQVAAENRQVLAESYRWSATQPSSLQKLLRIQNPPQRLMMNGNEAIALGAISAGLKFYSFYPMTPATSIALTLASYSNQMKLIVEQAEDEIAAINMAIGASFAGAPSMVGTSGGGFALMVEGVSLAAMTETPIVIVVAQRPAPATGLPTRTEQADLGFVLHAGHGEFPRVILTPGTVEECFYLTRKAFELAERYHGPVFILTDQFLADSYRAVEPFDVENLRPFCTAGNEAILSQPYRRYMLTDSGVSPRLLPGMTEHLVVADSDEHTEEGHLTEDLSIRRLMVEKRLKKESGIRKEATPPVYEGDENPEMLLVSWGSTRGAASEAALRIKSNGKSIATLHFQQVWPLVPEQFIKYLEKSKEVVCIEGNATGQLSLLIRRETGFDIKRHILRYDGLPITPEYILRSLGI